MGFLNEVVKFIFYLSALHLYSCVSKFLVLPCVLCVVTANWRTLRALLNISPYSLCTAVQQAGCLPSKVSAVFDCCLTEPQTGTLDTVQ